MFNVCFNCGEYHADKRVDPEGPFAICPACGYKHLFLRLPLLIISGASGAGKSTVCHHLLGTLPEVVLLDSDILWRAEFNQPETHHRAYFETWLRLGKSIGQSGRPVVLFGAGIGVPANMEPCVERRYFSTLHYLALTCDDEVLADRLRQRPAWRQSSHEVYIQEHLSFNRWFQENGAKTDPVITLLDTTGRSVQETVVKVAKWIKEKINC
jgi:predicted kinase